MPPPTNQTSTTAINIGTLTGYTAYSTTQDAYSTTATTTVQLWYSYTPVAGDDVLEVYGYGNGTTFLPSLDVFSGPVSSTTSPANTRSSLGRPVQQDIITDIVAGQDVFFRFWAITNVNPAITTIRIARGQKELITDGDLYINDSSPGYPGIVMSPTTAIPKRYELNYPAGEGQQVLTNGIVAVIDLFTSTTGPRLYDVATNGFTARATPVMPDNQYTDGLSTNQIDTFVATARNHGGGANNSLCVFITATTNVVSSSLDLGSPNIENVVPQADLSAVYGENGTDVQKITNPGGIVTTFLTVDAGFNFGINLLMMTDDTLLVVYEKAATVPYVKRFNLSATLLNTITLTGVTAGIELECLFAAKDDPVHFWIWWQTSVLNRFQKYRVSDGALITDLSRNKFVESVSQTTVLAGDTVYSGADFSCKPIILRLSAAGSGSGLYKLTGTNIDNVRVAHDKLWVDASLGTTEDVAIPNPFAETYLVGDE